MGAFQETTNPKGSGLMSVQREMMSEELEEERPWEAHAWLRAETLAALAELNEQCIEMLTLQFATTSVHQSPLLVREIGPLLRGMDPDARHRAAACPYLLFDAGFADQQRWAWVSGRTVSDLHRKEPAYFTLQQTRSMARVVFTYAWHLARSQNAAARLLLGMSAHVARLVAVCTLRQIHDLAEAHPEWLLPRWATRPGFWRELLVSASTGDSNAMEQARMRGLQLMAAEQRALLCV
jgi:hypothetical protein